MHPFSVMQFFPTGRFITLCFYCFFWLKSFFRVQKNSPKAVSVLDSNHTINTGIFKRLPA